MAPPVSVNKVRGPDSDQPKKIGMHAHLLIDHIFYSEKDEFLQHVLPPIRHVNSSLGLANLIPSMVTPSDHYPVVVDFK